MAYCVLACSVLRAFKTVCCTPNLPRICVTILCVYNSCCEFVKIYEHPRNAITTADPPTNIVDFGGFDSSTILILRGGILMSIGDFPESLSQAMLVGVMLVGRLCVFKISTDLVLVYLYGSLQIDYFQ